ncbi:MAG TPA: ComEA family DNA-binding protein [Nitriliruptorales bacterium]|nr:ComEA family DNA-binding protein [Nitriliruptorales bacterium]
MVARLDPTPAEAAGLALLLMGAGVLAALLWWTGGPRPLATGTVPTAAPSPVAGPVTVHVAGAVHTPGVVLLPGGSRVVDAIAAAGGARPDAALGGVNLARVLSDGEQVAVASAATPVGDGADPTSTPAGHVRDPGGRLDLNAATVDDLEDLPGIGPVLAGRIVAWREEYGRFTDVGQLREVTGIGERTFQQLADLVVVR